MANQYCQKCKSKLATCPTCGGKGTIKKDMGLFAGMKDVPCPNCNGTGKLCPRHGSDWG